jgi:hypothetical protein
MINLEREVKSELIVQGSDRTSMPEELKQGVQDYYSGRGMPVATFEKYYGLKTRIEVKTVR